VNKKIKIIIIGIVLLTIDQVTKSLIIDKSYTIIPNILNFTYTQNNGIAFGMGMNRNIVIIISIILLLAFLVLLVKNINKISIGKTISLLLIIVGGISNIIDRIFRNYVIDFIDVSIFSFPNFNLADIYIVVGIFMFALSSIKRTEILENRKEK